MATKKSWTRRTAVRLARPPAPLMRLLVALLTGGVAAALVIGSFQCLELVD